MTYQGNNSYMNDLAAIAQEGDLFYLINGGDEPKKAYEFISGVWTDKRIEARAFELGMAISEDQYPLTQEDRIQPTLLNDWEVYTQPTYGDIGYRKTQFGTVKLYGALTSGTANLAAFQLPEGYRPTHDIFVLVPSGGTTTCKVKIDTDGNVAPSTYSTAVYLWDIEFDTY